MKKILFAILVLAFNNHVSAQTEQQRIEKVTYQLSKENVKLLKTTATFDALTSGDFENIKNACYQKEEIVLVKMKGEKEIEFYYTNAFFQNDLKLFIEPFYNYFELSKESEVHAEELKEGITEKI